MVEIVKWETPRNYLGADLTGWHYLTYPVVDYTESPIDVSNMKYAYREMTNRAGIWNLNDYFDEDDPAVSVAVFYFGGFGGGSHILFFRPTHNNLWRAQRLRDEMNKKNVRSWRKDGYPPFDSTLYRSELNAYAIRMWNSLLDEEQMELRKRLNIVFPAKTVPAKLRNYFEKGLY